MNNEVYVFITRFGQGSPIVEGVFTSLDIPNEKMKETRKSYHLAEEDGHIDILNEYYEKGYSYEVTFVKLDTNREETVKFEIHHAELQ